MQPFAACPVRISLRRCALARRASAWCRADVAVRGRGIFLEENASSFPSSRGAVSAVRLAGVLLAAETRNDGRVERLSSRPVLKHGPRSLTCTRVVR
jgi:hypothetical protein